MTRDDDIFKDPDIASRPLPDLPAGGLAAFYPRSTSPGPRRKPRRIDWALGARLLAEGQPPESVARTLEIGEARLWRHLRDSAHFGYLLRQAIDRQRLVTQMHFAALGRNAALRSLEAGVPPGTDGLAWLAGRLGIEGAAGAPATPDLVRQLRETGRRRVARPAAKAGVPASSREDSTAHREDSRSHREDSRSHREDSRAHSQDVAAHRDASTGQREASTGHREGIAALSPPAPGQPDGQADGMPEKRRNSAALPGRSPPLSEAQLVAEARADLRATKEMIKAWQAAGKPSG